MLTPHPIKKTRVAWSTAAQEHLLSWMEETGNYDRYYSASKVLDGRQRSSGETKVSISKQSVTHLAGVGVTKTDEQVRTKITNFEDKWKEAHQ
ncbi:hypothetical protein RvY_10847 [Ramazzottius varieornatus]|uniref:Uncharacterized protein n=1 Tax=Ramazzottius varieornatus TaxID=947166 RepID=A0A1D1VIJ0_RAMVA|nr:hypothetical protein RvY_10847 [Ramazzottius varieornatus]